MFPPRQESNSGIKPTPCPSLPHEKLDLPVKWWLLGYYIKKLQSNTCCIIVRLSEKEREETPFSSSSHTWASSMTRGWKLWKLISGHFSIRIPVYCTHGAKNREKIVSVCLNQILTWPGWSKGRRFAHLYVDKAELKTDSISSFFLSRYRL